MSLSTMSVFKNLEVDDSDIVVVEGENVKRMQECLFNILADFDDFCLKHDIKYSLAGGSALGLVRHGGFIPWDDDVDLIISRSDYNKLVKEFDNGLSDRYWLHAPNITHDYGLGFARLRKKGTVCRAREDARDDKECGIFLELIIIENTYDFPPARLVHGFLSYLFGFTLSCRNFYKKRDFYLDLVSNDKKNYKVFKFKAALGKLLSFASVDRWTAIWNSVNSMCGNEHSKLVTVPVGRKHFFKETYLRSDVCEVERKEFLFDGKTHDFYLMKGVNAYLKSLYGDYMRIPPPEEREKHILLELDFGDEDV